MSRLIRLRQMRLPSAKIKNKAAQIVIEINFIFIVKATKTGGYTGETC